LSELKVGEQGDCFALLASKDRATTRDGKPYFRVSFRDAGRTVTAMIWSDTTWFADCDSKWQVGGFYKLRCQYFENQYGPQVELDRVRALEPADQEQGFDARHFYEHTRFNIDEMFRELLDVAHTQIDSVPVRNLVVALLEEHAELIQRMSAASRNHHAFIGGYLEHVLSVTRTCVHLADKYLAYYPDTHPPLSKSLVLAGAILHDVGKTLELRHQPQGADYTAQGRLIGHILLGRDLVRDKARELGELDPETQLRLEHIIVAHQNLPEWGSPVAPHTLEALLVHFADDLDAKYHMMARVLKSEPAPGEEFTSRDNPLRRMIFRGLQPEG
jgi:3'-5' exoribonuclease